MIREKQLGAIISRGQSKVNHTAVTEGTPEVQLLVLIPWYTMVYQDLTTSLFIIIIILLNVWGVGLVESDDVYIIGPRCDTKRS